MLRSATTATRIGPMQPKANDACASTDATSPSRRLASVSPAAVRWSPRLLFTAGRSVAQREVALRPPPAQDRSVKTCAQCAMPTPLPPAGQRTRGEPPNLPSHLGAGLGRATTRSDAPCLPAHIVATAAAVLPCCFSTSSAPRHPRVPSTTSTPSLPRLPPRPSQPQLSGWRPWTPRS